MSSLLILLIICGCAAYQYFKGNFVRSFMTLLVVILSIVPSFAFYEFVSSFIISRGGRMEKLVPIAHPLCFFVLFGLSFAIFQGILNALLKEKIDLGLLPERVGRAVCGIFTGLLISGILLTGLIISPLPAKYPYERFSSFNPSVENPKKAFFNVDGFVVGWFNLFSKGSLSGQRSFSVLHPNFLDTTFLNRLGTSKKISTAMPGSKLAIEVPKEKGVWPAPKGLTDTSGNVIVQKSGTVSMIVRVGLRKSLAQASGAFTPLQLRLICKDKSQVKKPYRGSANVVYPIGYMKTSEQMERKSLNETIKMQLTDFRETVKWVDFVFYVPSESVPLLLEFKLNTVLELSSPVDTKEAPEIIGFEILKEPQETPEEEPEAAEETSEVDEEAEEQD
jgi:peroxiredoxin family protein